MLLRRRRRRRSADALAARRRRRDRRPRLPLGVAGRRGARAVRALAGGEPARAGRARGIRAGVFVAGFAACAAPLFLFREGRTAPYFARAADHNVVLEMRRERSLLPPLAAAADAVASPWLLADPTPRHDLPGRARLGWLLGAGGRDRVRPRAPAAARRVFGPPALPGRRRPGRGRGRRAGGQSERIPLRLPHVADRGRGGGRHALARRSRSPLGGAARPPSRRSGR